MFSFFNLVSSCFIRSFLFFSFVWWLYSYWTFGLEWTFLADVGKGAGIVPAAAHVECHLLFPALRGHQFGEQQCDHGTPACRHTVIGGAELARMPEHNQASCHSILESHAGQQQHRRSKLLHILWTVGPDVGHALFLRTIRLGHHHQKRASGLVYSKKTNHFLQLFKIIFHVYYIQSNFIPFFHHPSFFIFLPFFTFFLNHFWIIFEPLWFIALDLLIFCMIFCMIFWMLFVFCSF